MKPFQHVKTTPQILRNHAQNYSQTAQIVLRKKTKNKLKPHPKYSQTTPQIFTNHTKYSQTTPQIFTNHTPFFCNYTSNTKNNLKTRKCAHSNHLNTSGQAPWICDYLSPADKPYGFVTCNNRHKDECRESATTLNFCTKQVQDRRLTPDSTSTRRKHLTEPRRD